jgi:hypothetical protein
MVDFVVQNIESLSASAGFDSLDNLFFPFTRFSRGLKFDSRSRIDFPVVVIGLSSDFLFGCSVWSPSSGHGVAAILAMRRFGG